MRSIITSLALVSSVCLAWSAEPKVNLRTLALPNSTLPELWIVVSGKPMPIAFSKTQPSEFIKADSSPPFNIYKGPFDEAGKPTDPSPTKVELPSASSILLLGWMESEKPAFQAIADPIASAKNDDWLVINRTSKQVKIQLGASATALPVEINSHQTIKCAVPGGEGAAVTVTSLQADSSWKVIYTSTWPVYADKRGLVVIAEKGDRINVNYITDDVPGGKNSNRR